MRIILEGVDGAGKTTLAKILAEKYNLDICHCGMTDPSDYHFYRETSKKDNVVWDRHTIGELIYPKVFGREQQCSPEDARIILTLGKQELGLKTLVLTTDIDILKTRLEVRGNEHPKILENLKWIDDQFRWYAEDFHLPLIDTSKMTLNEIFKLIEGDK